MAKFIAARPLNMEYAGHKLTGDAGTVFRLPDSLQAEFQANFGYIGLTWQVPDEIATVGGGGPHTHIEYASASVVSNHLSTGHVHNHDASYAPVHSHPYAATVHTHPESAITNLVSDLAGKAATGHTHSYAALSHSHADADLPAGIARDTEVTAAIVAHESTATHGGSLPSGLIVMWAGFVSAIPSGWALCDGQNGTPDLRGRFVKGAISQPGTTGGYATHTHAAHGGLSHSGTAVDDHASHTHTYTQVPNHVHVEQLQGGTTGATNGTHLMGSTATGGSLRSAGQSTLNPTGGVATGTTNGPSVALTHTVTQPSAHAAQSHDSPNHEPPYYELAFIQKL